MYHTKNSGTGPQNSNGQLRYTTFGSQASFPGQRVRNFDLERTKAEFGGAVNALPSNQRWGEGQNQDYMDQWTQQDKDTVKVYYDPTAFDNGVTAVKQTLRTFSGVNRQQIDRTKTANRLVYSSAHFYIDGHGTLLVPRGNDSPPSAEPPKINVITANGPNLMTSRTEFGQGGRPDADYFLEPGSNKERGKRKFKQGAKAVYKNQLYLTYKRALWVAETNGNRALVLGKFSMGLYTQLLEPNERREAEHLNLEALKQAVEEHQGQNLKQVSMVFPDSGTRRDPLYDTAASVFGGYNENQSGIGLSISTGDVVDVANGYKNGSNYREVSILNAGSDSTIGGHVSGAYNRLNTLSRGRGGGSKRPPFEESLMLMSNALQVQAIDNNDTLRNEATFETFGQGYQAKPRPQLTASSVHPHSSGSFSSGPGRDQAPIVQFLNNHPQRYPLERLADGNFKIKNTQIVADPRKNELRTVSNEVQDLKKMIEAYLDSGQSNLELVAVNQEAANNFRRAVTDLKQQGRALNATINESYEDAASKQQQNEQQYNPFLQMPKNI